MARRAIVVGGGIAGLACGHRLRQLGVDAVVLEAKSRPGGVVKTEPFEGMAIEWGPQTCVLDPGLRALAQELRLGLVERPKAERARFLVRGGRLVSPLRALSVLGLVRMAWGFVRKGEPPADDESVYRYVKRRFGDEAARRVFDPLVSGIYAGDSTKISYASALARFGNRPRGAVSGSFDGGMAALPVALAMALGRALKLEAPVTSIERASEQSERWRVHTGPPKVEVLEADDVVLACPAWVTADIVARIDNELAGELRSIKYAAVTAVTLVYAAEAFRRQPQGFGFLVAREERLPILGCLFVPAPKGRVGLRVMMAGLPQDAAPIARKAVEPLLGATAEPLLVRVVRHDRAIPQYDTGHAARLRAIDSRFFAQLPRVHLAGNAYRGVAVPDVIEDARRVAQSIAQPTAP